MGSLLDELHIALNTYFTIGGVVVGLGLLYHMYGQNMTLEEAWVQEQRQAGLEAKPLGNVLQMLWRLFILMLRWPWVVFVPHE